MAKLAFERHFDSQEAPFPVTLFMVIQITQSYESFITRGTYVITFILLWMTTQHMGIQIWAAGVHFETYRTCLFFDQHLLPWQIWNSSCWHFDWQKKTGMNEIFVTCFHFSKVSLFNDFLFLLISSRIGSWCKISKALYIQNSIYASR